VMQLDQKSRWQTWMRMLAVDIQSVPGSASSIGPTGSGVYRWCHTAIEGSTLLAAELKATFLNVGRSNENTD
jgi:hypothetical protein